MLENMSREFNKNTPILLSGVMKQVESGNQTWGLKEDKSVWVLMNDKWENSNTNKNLNYISVGKAGVWGLSTSNEVVVRKGRLDEFIHALLGGGGAVPLTQTLASPINKITWDLRRIENPYHY